MKPDDDEHAAGHVGQRRVTGCVRRRGAAVMDLYYVWQDITCNRTLQEEFAVALTVGDDPEKKFEKLQQEVRVCAYIRCCSQLIASCRTRALAT